MRLSASLLLTAAGCADCPAPTATKSEAVRAGRRARRSCRPHARRPAPPTLETEVVYLSED